MSKIYNIYLNNELIGKSFLEKGDAPMGVVQGKINFINEKYDYNFIKKYCEENLIKLPVNDKDFKCISTSIISKLKIQDDKGKEIVGIGNIIEGMDNDFYEIIILGIPYPFYEKEFPNHVEKYYNLLQNKV